MLFLESKWLLCAITAEQFLAKIYNKDLTVASNNEIQLLFRCHKIKTFNQLDEVKLCFQDQAWRHHQCWDPPTEVWKDLTTLQYLNPFQLLFVLVYMLQTKVQLGTRKPSSQPPKRSNHWSHSPTDNYRLHVHQQKTKELLLPSIQQVTIKMFKEP